MSLHGRKTYKKKVPDPKEKRKNENDSSGMKKKAKLCSERIQRNPLFFDLFINHNKFAYDEGEKSDELSYFDYGTDLNFDSFLDTDSKYYPSNESKYLLDTFSECIGMSEGLKSNNPHIDSSSDEEEEEKDVKYIKELDQDSHLLEMSELELLFLQKINCGCKSLSWNSYNKMFSKNKVKLQESDRFDQNPSNTIKNIFENKLKINDSFLYGHNVDKNKVNEMNSQFENINEEFVNAQDINSPSNADNLSESNNQFDPLGGSGDTMMAIDDQVQYVEFHDQHRERVELLGIRKDHWKQLKVRMDRKSLPKFDLRELFKHGKKNFENTSKLPSQDKTFTSFPNFQAPNLELLNAVNSLNFSDNEESNHSNFATRTADCASVSGVRPVCVQESDSDDDIQEIFVENTINNNVSTAPFNFRDNLTRNRGPAAAQTHFENDVIEIISSDEEEEVPPENISDVSEQIGKLNKEVAVLKQLATEKVNASKISSLFNSNNALSAEKLDISENEILLNEAKDETPFSTILTNVSATSPKVSAILPHVSSNSTEGTRTEFITEESMNEKMPSSVLSVPNRTEQDSILLVRNVFHMKKVGETRENFAKKKARSRLSSLQNCNAKSEKELNFQQAKAKKLRQKTKLEKFRDVLKGNAFCFGFKANKVRVKNAATQKRKKILREKSKEFIHRKLNFKNDHSDKTESIPVESNFGSHETSNCSESRSKTPDPLCSDKTESDNIPVETNPASHETSNCSESRSKSPDTLSSERNLKHTTRVRYFTKPKRRKKGHRKKLVSLKVPSRSKNAVYTRKNSAKIPSRPKNAVYTRKNSAKVSKISDLGAEIVTLQKKKSVENNVFEKCENISSTVENETIGSTVESRDYSNKSLEENSQYSEFVPSSNNSHSSAVCCDTISTSPQTKSKDSCLNASTIDNRLNRIEKNSTSHINDTSQVNVTHNNDELEDNSNKISKDVGCKLQETTSPVNLENISDTVNTSEFTNSEKVNTDENVFNTLIAESSKELNASGVEICNDFKSLEFDSINTILQNEENESEVTLSIPNFVSDSNFSTLDEDLIPDDFENIDIDLVLQNITNSFENVLEKVASKCETSNVGTSQRQIESESDTKEMHPDSSTEIKSFVSLPSNSESILTNMKESSNSPTSILGCTSDFLPNSISNDESLLTIRQELENTGNNSSESESVKSRFLFNSREQDLMLDKVSISQSPKFFDASVDSSPKMIEVNPKKLKKLCSSKPNDSIIDNKSTDLKYFDISVDTDAVTVSKKKLAKSIQITEFSDGEPIGQKVAKPKLRKPNMQKHIFCHNMEKVKVGSSVTVSVTPQDLSKLLINHMKLKNVNNASEVNKPKEVNKLNNIRDIDVFDDLPDTYSKEAEEELHETIKNAKKFLVTDSHRSTLENLKSKGLTVIENYRKDVGKSFKNFDSNSESFNQSKITTDNKGNKSFKESKSGSENTENTDKRSKNFDLNAESFNQSTITTDNKGNKSFKQSKSVSENTDKSDENSDSKEVIGITTDNTDKVISENSKHLGEDLNNIGDFGKRLENSILKSLLEKGSAFLANKDKKTICSNSKTCESSVDKDLNITETANGTTNSEKLIEMSLTTEEVAGKSIKNNKLFMRGLTITDDTGKSCIPDLKVCHKQKEKNENTLKTKNLIDIMSSFKLRGLTITGGKEIDRLLYSENNSKSVENNLNKSLATDHSKEKDSLVNTVQSKDKSSDITENKERESLINNVERKVKNLDITENKEGESLINAIQDEVKTNSEIKENKTSTDTVKKKVRSSNITKSKIKESSINTLQNEVEKNAESKEKEYLIDTSQDEEENLADTVENEVKSLTLTEKLNKVKESLIGEKEKENIIKLLNNTINDKANLTDNFQNELETLTLTEKLNRLKKGYLHS